MTGDGSAAREREPQTGEERLKLERKKFKASRRNGLLGSREATTAAPVATAATEHAMVEKDRRDRPVTGGF